MARSTESLDDPARCIHIDDRESDISEWFCAAHEAGTSLLVRTCVDRLAGEGATTISVIMEHEPILGDHMVEVRDDPDRASTVRMG